MFQQFPNISFCLTSVLTQSIIFCSWNRGVVYCLLDKRRHFLIFIQRALVFSLCSLLEIAFVATKQALTALSSDSENTRVHIINPRTLYILVLFTTTNTAPTSSHWRPRVKGSPVGVLPTKYPRNPLYHKRTSLILTHLQNISPNHPLNL